MSKFGPIANTGDGLIARYKNSREGFAGTREETVALNDSDSRSLSFLRSLDRNFCNSTFEKDVTFLVDDHEIQAHRFILTSKSQVFRSMFANEMKESRTGKIEIQDASAPAIEALVEYCYSAKIRFSGSIFPDEILKVAHKYDLSQLKVEAECELIKRLTQDNAFEALEISYDYGAKSLQQACLYYFGSLIPIDSGNLLQLLKVSYEYDVAPLKARALECFRKNYDSMNLTVFDNLLSAWKKK